MPRRTRLPQVAAIDRRSALLCLRVTIWLVEALLSMPGSVGTAAGSPHRGKYGKAQYLGIGLPGAGMLCDPACDLRPGVETEFGKDVLEVALDRPLGEEKALGDRATGQ